MPSAKNRVKLYKVEAELKRWLKIEEEFWKHKFEMRWLVEEDKKFNFFHSYVKGRRKKLHISKINSRQGIALQINQQIGMRLLHFS